LETRAHHVIVGVFVIAALVAIFVVAIWLAGVRGDKESKIYDIYFRGSVSGLNQGAPVRYKGIPIGRIATIRLDPESVERIRVRIEIDPGVPIKEDAVASLESEGITGQAFVQISGGSNASSELEAREDKRYPIIASRPSGLESVVSSAPELFLKATVVADRLAALLSNDNITAFTQTMQHLDSLSGTLAARGGDVDTLIGNASSLTSDLREAVATANRMLGELDRSINAKDGVGDKLAMTLQQFQQSAKGLNDMTADLDAVIRDNRGALRDFGLRGLPQAEQLITDARALVTELTRIADQLERDPARFLFGDRREGFKPR
jgi:phospholipid/cholesterol/gamma-HCH transport system substrate-binding protein